ncbi:zinc-ribbon domain-containing protein [uncultured Megasphaera sp.]|uniref:zinc-ribbon domain-containing protein n=1 Tax=uncultured Megasphaera sp. TaxID=165188 RepID=UPI002670999D|nr:zinc-ribbon domain-containing protein [uncultured Megasphaera sp.]
MSKQCTNCGAAIPDNSKFCEFCGKPVEAEKKKQPVCLHCGAPIAKGDAFCTACGTPVEAPVEEEKAEKKQPSVPEETSPAAEEPLKIVKLQEPETEPVQENDAPLENVHTSGPEQDTASAKEPAANGSTRAYCQTCGAPLAADDKFCMACGTPVAAMASGQEVVTTAAEEPLHTVKLADDVPAQGPEAKENAVTHCPSCGAVLAAEDKFCTACGAPVAATASGQEVVTAAAEEPLHTVKLADDVPAQGSETKENAVTHCLSCGAVLAAEEPLHTVKQADDVPAQGPEAKGNAVTHCPSCGAVLAAGDKFCTTCGVPVAATASGQEAVSAAAEEPLHIVKLADDVPAQGTEFKETAVTHCPSCGAVLAADDTFCTTCGAPVEAKPAVPEAAATSKTLYCHSCGAVVNAGDTFCASCGAPIRAVSKVRQGNDPLPVVHLHDEIPPHTGSSGQPGTGSAGVPPVADGAELLVKNIKPLLSVIAAIAAILFLLFKFSSGGAVQEVKEMKFHDFSTTVTIGQAFDRRFEEEDWSSEGSGKVKTVIFKGRDKDTGKMWKVYFKVTEGKEYYQCEVTKIVVDQTVSTNNWDVGRLLTYIYDG